MNILVTLDSNYIKHLIVMLTSLINSNSNENFNIYIVHSSITNEEFKYIRLSIDENKCNIIDVKIDSKIFENAPVTKRYPVEMYYRIFASHYLSKNLDRILYLDPDIIIINSIKHLYNMDMGKNFFAASSHLKNKQLKKFNEIRLEMPQNSTYINSGVMLMNLKELRKHQNKKEVYEYINNFKLRLFLPDQDVLNGVYAHKTIHINPLKYNLSDKYLNLYNLNPTNFDKKKDLRWVTHNTSIIHYCGKNKPWKDNYKGELGVFYYYFENIAFNKSFSCNVSNKIYESN